ncbi:MAG: carboxypeptidase-like regulatory domain-containing protein, partial [Blastocatellia bacterium]
MPKFIVTFFLFLFALCFVEPAFAQSQTTGRVKGIVRDINTKAPIPGAVVVITNLARNVPDSARTNAAGEYSFDFIETGEYQLSTTCDGYDVTPMSKIDRLPVNLRIVNEVTPPPLELLKSGTVVAPATPVATAAPPTAATSGSVIRLVNLEDATRSLGFDAAVITALPLAEMRSFDQLALLAAGVASPPQAIGNTTGPGLGAGVGTSGQFAVNGLRSRGNNFTVDGSDNNDEDIGVRRQGFTALVPQAIETLQQFNIATLLPRPQFGRNLGAQVDAVSQYGGSRVHGGL